MLCGGRDPAVTQLRVTTSPRRRLSAESLAQAPVRWRTKMVSGGACRPVFTMVQIDPSTRRRTDPGEGGELGLG